MANDDLITALGRLLDEKLEPVKRDIADVKRNVADVKYDVANLRDSLKRINIRLAVVEATLLAGFW